MVKPMTMFRLNALAAGVLAAAAAAMPAAAQRPTGGPYLSPETRPEPVGPYADGRYFEARCDPAAGCPEIAVAGDMLDAPCLDPAIAPAFELCPVRGRYDPSISADPETDELWLSYTRGSLAFRGRPHPRNVAGRHDLMVARSVDGGLSWTLEARAETGRAERRGPLRPLMMAAHEVSTLERLPDGRWGLAWLQYVGRFEQTAIMARTAATPGRLGEGAAETLISGWAGPRDRGVLVDPADVLPEPARCAALSEPALFTHEGVAYLAVECVGWDRRRNARDYAAGAIELLRWDGAGELAYVGRLVDAEDARAVLGPDAIAPVLTQPAIARSRVRGRLLLLLTPADPEAAENHRACIALEIEDLASARVRREPDGTPALLARVDADFEGHLGPGLCDYDPASETGVLITLMRENRDIEPIDLRVSVHATGVHP